MLCVRKLLPLLFHLSFREPVAQNIEVLDVFFNETEEKGYYGNNSKNCESNCTAGNKNCDQVFYQTNCEK